MSSFEVFSAIQDTDEMKDVDESAGDGGPELTERRFEFISKWGFSSLFNIAISKKRERGKESERI